MTLMQPGRICTKCFTYKEWGEFYRKANGWHGYASECKPCRRVYEATRKEKRAAYHREWRARRDPEVKHREQVKYAYGISASDYDALVARQGGLCAACGKPETREYGASKVRRLSLDHCHVTGRHRGLLCNACNRAIGFAKDDADRLAGCAEYLRRATALSSAS